MDRAEVKMVSQHEHSLAVRSFRVNLHDKTRQLVPTPILLKVQFTIVCQK